MRTPLQAMLWELWRTSRVDLLLRMVGLLSGVLLLWGLSSFRDESDAEMLVINGIVVMLLVITSAASPTWIRAVEQRHSGFTFRLGFARPVTTARLVAVPMIFSAAEAVGCYLLPASMYGLLSGTSLPLLGPAAVVGVAVMFFMAASWSPTSSWGKLVALVALAIGAIVSLNLFNAQQENPGPILMAIGTPEFFALTWQHYAAMAIGATMALVVTVWAVERQRRGDRWELTGRGLGRPRAARSARRTRRPFTSRFAAQCWYEMRRLGPKVILLGMFGAGLIFAFAMIVPWMNPHARWDGAPGVWLGALVLCPFVFQIVGADGALGLQVKQGATRLTAFDASRAMANDQLIGCKLLVIAATSMIGWLCMALAAVLHAAVAGQWQAWARMGEALATVVGDVPAYWWLAAIASAVLLYVSSTSILLAFGLWLPLHGRRFLLLAGLSYAQVWLAVWDAASPWSLWYLWTAYGYVVAVATVIGCLLALRKALVAGYLGKSLFGCAFCLWVVYVASTVALFINLAPATALPRVAIVSSVSLLLVPLATTAIAPLALASHRHG